MSAEQPDTERTSHRNSPTPIVPPGNIAGQAMSLVIAIIAFLACLTVGAVALLGQSATTWQGQISREATVQIRPAEGFDIEAALEQARVIASGFAGVRAVDIVSLDASAELLEPWLGTGLDLSQLPVPRLVVITIDEASPPDFAALREAITSSVPNATLDDHRAFVARLVSMARATVYAGLVVLVLVLTALVMTVIFATRGAMAGNHDVIEVLHFVGARDGFIARQFQRRFLVIAMRGALAGGIAALAVFHVISWWARRNVTRAAGEQLSAFFGDFSIGWQAGLGVAAVVVAVGVLTLATARITVLQVLRDIDEKRSNPVL